MSPVISMPHEGYIRTFLEEYKDIFRIFESFKIEFHINFIINIILKNSRFL